MLGVIKKTVLQADIAGRGAMGTGCKELEIWEDAESFRVNDRHGFLVTGCYLKPVVLLPGLYL